MIGFPRELQFPLHIVLLPALLLAGCGTGPERLPAGTTPAQAQAERERRLSAIEHWVCVGRVGVSDGEESLNAALRWTQSRDRYRIRLSGLFGQGLMEISGSGAGVTLRTAERGALTAASPETLLLEEFGWRLPVSGLRYWILGVAVPETAVTSAEVDALGRLEHLEQSGWRIRYLEYRRIDGLDLPSRIELEHPQLSARIAVRSWQLAT